MRIKGRYSNSRMVDKIPSTKLTKNDRKCCFICGRGPLSRNDREDVMSMDGTDQVWCLRCFQLACK